MWHSDCDHTEDEIKVLRELEYDLFMFNPGFRQLWGNDFEAYFNALFSENKWTEHIERYMDSTESNISLRMLQDPEFAQFMKQQAIIDEVISGDLPIENAPVEMRADLKDIVSQSNLPEEDSWDEENSLAAQDPLYLKAENWGVNLTKIVGPLYEQKQITDLFRILVNSTMVAAKIAFAHSSEDDTMEEIDTESGWATDRIGYTLSLTSLNRCLESLTRLKKNNLATKLKINLYINTGKEIKQELFDRLDTIEQKRYFKKHH